MKTTPIICQNCDGGLKLNVFTGKFDTCRHCAGTTEQYLCDTFVAFNKMVILRNTSCDNCGQDKWLHEAAIKTGRI